MVGVVFSGIKASLSLYKRIADIWFIADFVCGGFWLSLDHQSSSLSAAVMFDGGSDTVDFILTNSCCAVDVGPETVEWLQVIVLTSSD